MNILGIDIGTTSICMVLYDPKKRKIVEMQSVQNAFLLAGNFLQDADEIVKKVEEMLKKWESFSFDAVGISSQMHGIVYVSDSGRAVSPLYTWKNPWGNCTFKNGESLPGTLRGEPDIPYIPDMVQSPIFIFRQRGTFPGTLSDLWILGIIWP